MKYIPIIALLITSSATAADWKDFQGQTYHGDLSNPDRVTPPPAPQYPQRRVPPYDEQVCSMATIDHGWGPPEVVKICTIPQRYEPRQYGYGQ